MSDALLIIQARLTSSRLPRKVLLPICDRPAVVYLYERLKVLAGVVRIVVAIPEDKDNNELARELEVHNVPYLRGAATDVFARFKMCIGIYAPRMIIRVNADCPLLSPSTVERSIAVMNSMGDLDYVSTTLDDAFPVGEHVECFTSTAFDKSEKFLDSAAYREHVTPAIYNNPDRFSCQALLSEVSYPSGLRLCVDYFEDYRFISSIAEHFSPRIDFDLSSIVDYVSENPRLLKINNQYSKSRVFTR